MTKIYCVKCRKKVEVKDIKKVEVNGRCALKGYCEKCGTKVTQFVKC